MGAEGGAWAVPRRAPGPERPAPLSFPTRRAVLGAASLVLTPRVELRPSWLSVVVYNIR